MAFCPQCGSALPENTAFCPRCGRPLSAGAASAKKPKKSLLRRWWFWVLALAAILLVAKAVKGGGGSQDKTGRSGVRTEATERVLPASEEARDPETTDPNGGSGHETETESLTETEPPTETENPPATEAHGPARPDNEIRQELVDFLAAYEAFMDEYVAFMDSYKKAEGSELLGMLKEYAEIMKRYREFSELADAFDYGDMTLAESQYYSEVMSRISQKLLGSLDG